MVDNLFTHAAEEHFDAFAPLAARMRPRCLDDLVGQSHLVGPAGPLRSLISADRLGSILLWGPAGTGKTSLAGIVASASRARFVTLSAVSGTVADVRKAIAVAPEAVSYIVDRSGGDARVALNALEATVAAAVSAGAGEATEETAAAALQQPLIRYDKAGDAHYDAISAFIKSMRGSDPDAAVWWLAAMLEAGEDPRFIARRMVILASEDVGNADPMALVVAVAAAQALELVGLPEAKLNLSPAAIYLSTAPKSNASMVAIGRATEDVQRHGAGEVPPHLRGTGYPGAKRLGHGKGYLYPHDHPGGWVAQSYLPEGLPRTEGRHYYEPADRGAEAAVAERLRKLRSPETAEKD